MTSKPSGSVSWFQVFQRGQQLQQHALRAVQLTELVGKKDGRDVQARWSQAYSSTSPSCTAMSAAGEARDRARSASSRVRARGASPMSCFAPVARLIQREPTLARRYTQTIFDRNIDGARMAVRGGEAVIRPLLGLAVVAMAGKMLGLY